MTVLYRIDLFSHKRSVISWNFDPHASLQTGIVKLISLLPDYQSCTAYPLVTTCGPDVVTFFHSPAKCNNKSCQSGVNNFSQYQQRDDPIYGTAFQPGNEMVNAHVGRIKKNKIERGIGQKGISSLNFSTPAT